jgi:hypothetical protein
VVQFQKSQPTSLASSFAVTPINRRKPKVTSADYNTSTTSTLQPSHASVTIRVSRRSVTFSTKVTAQQFSSSFFKNQNIPRDKKTV